MSWVATCKRWNLPSGSSPRQVAEAIAKNGSPGPRDAARADLREMDRLDALEASQSPQAQLPPLEPDVQVLLDKYLALKERVDKRRQARQPPPNLATG